MSVNTDKSQMTGFIQALYGVVIGISLPNIKVSLTAIFSGSLDGVKARLEFAFFVFTMVIAAHDWFRYHKDKKDVRSNFIYYMPQLMSLLFLGIMFRNYEFNSIPEWYCLSWGYTGANILGLLLSFGNESGNKYTCGEIIVRIIKYSIHVAIPFLFFYVPNRWTDYSYTISLSLTIFAVVLIWCFEDWAEKKLNDKCRFCRKKGPAIEELRDLSAEKLEKKKIDDKINELKNNITENEKILNTVDLINAMIEKNEPVTWEDFKPTISKMQGLTDAQAEPYKNIYTEIEKEIKSKNEEKIKILKKKLSDLLFPKIN